MIAVRLVGDLDLEIDGRPAALPSRRSGRLLLAWLALHPGEHSRDDVAARFWPQTLPSSARASLRTALASLRDALGPSADRHVRASRGTVALVGADVDVHLLRRGDRLAEVTTELLRGYSEPWVLDAREAFREEVCAALAGTAARAEAAGDLAGAVAHDRRRIALDPLGEAAHRDLMRRLTANGDRAGALATFAALAERLRRDLRTAPSRATRDLASELRREAPAPPPRPPWPAPPPPVGREEERRRLDAALAAGRTVVVSGARGSGKTALARGAALACGRAVLAVECDAPGYEPLARALAAWAAAPLGPLPPEAADLAALVPDLADQVTALPPPPLDREPDGRRLTAAFAATLGALAAHRRFLLVADRAERAAPETLAVLDRLAAEPGPLALLLVTREPGPRWPGAESITLGAQDRSDPSGRLASLSSDALAVLRAAAVAGESFDLDLAVAVAGAGEREVLAALEAATGAGLVREDGPASFAFAAPAIAETLVSSIPATRLAVLHRAAGRALAARRDAGLRVAPGAIARHLLAAGPLALIDAAEEARRAADASAARHAHHDALDLLEAAESALARDAPGRTRDRAELLVRIAEERWQCERPDGVRDAALAAAALAPGDGHLIARAALALAAVPYFPGEDSVDRKAVALLERALELLGDGDAALRARVTAQLSRELRFGGDRAASVAHAVAARELGERSGDASASAAALDALHVAHAGAGDAELRLEAAQDLLRLARDAHLPEAEVRGRVWLAVDQLELGDPGGLRREGAALDRLARGDVPRPGLGWWPALWRASCALLRGDSGAGRRLADAALAAGVDAYGPAAALEHQAQLLWAHWLENSLVGLAGTVEVAREQHPGIATWHCLAALIAAETGPARDARAEIARLDLDRLQADPNWLVGAMVLAEACVLAGEQATAAALRDRLEPFDGRWAVGGYASVCLGPVSAALALLGVPGAWERALGSERAAGADLACARFARVREALA